MIALRLYKILKDILIKINILNKNKIEIVKIWTNASPTSSFANQTLTISGLEDYPDFAMEWGLTETGAYKNVTLFKKGYGGILVGNRYASDNAKWYLCHRGFTFTSPNKLVFDSAYTIAYTNGASNVNNKRMIPIAIYGIKGVQ